MREFMRGIPVVTRTPVYKGPRSNDIPLILDQVLDLHRGHCPD